MTKKTVTLTVPENVYHIFMDALEGVLETQEEILDDLDKADLEDLKEMQQAWADCQAAYKK